MGGGGKNNCKIIVKVFRQPRWVDFQDAKAVNVEWIRIEKEHQEAEAVLERE